MSVKIAQKKLEPTRTLQFSHSIREHLKKWRSSLEKKSDQGGITVRNFHGFVRQRNTVLANLIKSGYIKDIFVREYPVTAIRGKQNRDATLYTFHKTEEGSDKGLDEKKLEQLIRLTFCEDDAELLCVGDLLRPRELGTSDDIFSTGETRCPSYYVASDSMPTQREQVAVRCSVAER